MIKRHQHNLQEEPGVILSLAFSPGMVILIVVGWWMWKILTPIVAVTLSTTSIDIL